MNGHLLSLPIDSRLFETIVAQVPDAVIFTDREGVIQLWNRGAEVLFGFAADDVIGTRMDVIIPERFRQAHWEGFRRAVASGCTRHGDCVRTTRAVHRFGHKLYVELSFGLVKDSGGSVIGSVAMGRDCSSRHVSEKALRERIHELEREVS